MSKPGRRGSARPDRVGRPRGAGAWLGGPRRVSGAGRSQHRRTEPTGDLCSCLATPKPGLEANEAGDVGGCGLQPPASPWGVPPLSGGPPISPRQPQAPRHGPKLKAGSADSTEVWKNGWVCRSGWKTPQIWGGGMLLRAGKGPPNPKSGAPSSAWSPFGDITPGLQRMLGGTQCPAMPTLPHHPHPRHLHPRHPHPHPPSGPSPK